MSDLTKEDFDTLDEIEKRTFSYMGSPFAGEITLDGEFGFEDLRKIADIIEKTKHNYLGTY